MPTLDEYRTMLDEAVSETGAADMDKLTKVFEGITADLNELTAAQEQLTKATADLGALAAQNVALGKKAWGGTKPESSAPAAGDTDIDAAAVMKGWLGNG